jgi:hypothetical protein
MNDELGPQEDISALWGTQGNGVLDPAPPRVERPANRTANGHDQDDRVAALERELRQLRADLTQRLERLERQVASASDGRRAGLARITKALKGH